MKYHRISIRLDGYDYSNNGFYFVTICCQNRDKIFGEIIKKNVGAGLVPALMENKMVLNNVGIMAEKIVLEYFIKNKLIGLDEFIIMPDHIHMIMVIKKQFNNDVNIMAGDEINMVGTNNRATTNVRATTRVAPTTMESNKTLGMIIGELKSLITNEYIKNVKQNNWPKFDKRLWQRNYYERIIRNEKEYLIYKKYVRDNTINFDNQKAPRKRGFNV